MGKGGISQERRSVLTVTYVDVSAFLFTGDDHSLESEERLGVGGGMGGMGERSRELFVIGDNLTRDYEPNFYAADSPARYRGPFVTLAALLLRASLRGWRKKILIK